MNPLRLSMMITVCFAVSILATSTSHAQSIRYVDDDAEAGGNGQSWTTAYKYLQDALSDARVPGNGINEIRVAAGTYKPDQGQSQSAGDRSAIFHLVNNVALRGGFAGLGAPDPDVRDITANISILSGDLAGNDGLNFSNNDENRYHVVRAYLTTSQETYLDGFIITSGNANYSDPHYSGAGMVIEKDSNPTVVHCAFIGNAATADGGAVILSGTPRFINCRFLHKGP